jgi:disulfide oxidoreductase YuzD
MVRAEVEQRFGESAEVRYVDTGAPEARAAHKETIDEIHSRELLFPVTVVDGMPLYDGAVSFPAIIRAIEVKLAESAATA